MKLRLRRVAMSEPGQRVTERHGDCGRDGPTAAYRAHGVSTTNRAPLVERNATTDSWCSTRTTRDRNLIAPQDDCLPRRRQSRRPALRFGRSSSGCRAAARRFMGSSSALIIRPNLSASRAMVALRFRLGAHPATSRCARSTSRRRCGWRSLFAEHVASSSGGQRTCLQLTALDEARQQRVQCVALYPGHGGKLCAGGAWAFLRRAQNGLAIGATRRTPTRVRRRRRGRLRRHRQAGRRRDSSLALHVAERLDGCGQAAVLVYERTQFRQARADLFMDAVK
jgi:hypothetical protein